MWGVKGERLESDRGDGSTETTDSGRVGRIKVTDRG